MCIIFFIIRKHHGDAVPEGEVLGCNVEPDAAFVRPDCADRRPDFLPLLVFASIPTMVEDVRWCVWHKNVRECYCLQCRGLAGRVNTRRSQAEPPMGERK